MKIYFGKKYITKSIITKINDLFNENYSNYHYKELLTNEGVKKLLENKTFECVFIMDEDKLIGFAGFYVYNEINPVQIIFSHLLVQKKYRGQGLGNRLEDERMYMIKNIQSEKIVYASCVEKPYNSISMKNKRNFHVCGFRYAYRPADSGRDNAVIMVYDKYVSKENIIQVEEPSDKTKNIMMKLNPHIKFIKSESAQECRYKVEQLSNKDVGRAIYKLDEGDFGKTLYEIVKDEMEENISFVSIHVTPSISGFSKIDTILLEHNFIPMVYIPYINNYYGELEYQLMDGNLLKLLEDESITEIGKSIIKCLEDKIILI